MELKNLHFDSHGSCEALTAAMLAIPGPQRNAHKMTFEAGSAIWQPAALPTSVYLLIAGEVSIFEIEFSGKECLIERVKVGQVFGYLCFCSHRFEALTTEARASVTSVAIQTSVSAFQKAMKRDPGVSTLLTETLCHRTAQMTERLSLLSINAARPRLLALLQQLARQKLQHLASVAPPAEVSVHISHAEIAMQLCLTRPHVTTLMTRLRSQGVIHYERGSPVRIQLTKLN